MVASFRKLVGATNPLSAEPGTIRGDYGRVTGRNIVHASDSPDNGVREAGVLHGITCCALLLVRTPNWPNASSKAHGLT